MLSSNIHCKLAYLRNHNCIKTENLKALNNILTISRGIESSDVVEVITEEGTVYSDSIKTEYNVRSSFSLKSNLKITGGEGTLDKPYLLGEAEEGEQGNETKN